MHRCGEFLQENERAFLARVVVEVHQPEHLFVQLCIVGVLGDVLDDLSYLDPLALYMIRVDGEELAVEGDCVAELDRVVDGQSRVVLVELPRISTPLVAHQD